MIDTFLKSVIILLTYFSGYFNQPINFGGSGILVQYENNYYAVSCRHIVDHYPQYEIGFKVFTKNELNNPKRKTVIVDKKSLHTHPEDKPNKTFDISVFPINNSIKFRNVVDPFCLNLSANSYFPKLDINDTLVAIGYPQWDYEVNDVNNDNIALMPKIISGEFLYELPHSEVKLSNYDKLFQEQLYFSINIDSDVSGISGGLVLVKKDNAYYPIGLITSVGNGSYAGVEVVFIGFTHISRIVEIIAAL